MPQHTSRDTRTAAAYACLAAAATFVSVASLVARMPPVEPFAVIMVPAVIVGLLAFATVHGRALGAPELWRGAPTRDRILICGMAAVLVASLALGGGASTSVAKVRDGRHVALQHGIVVRVLSKQEYEDLRMKEFRTGMAILGLLSGFVAFAWSAIGEARKPEEFAVASSNPPDGRIS
jgi:hypothetical protein